MKKSFRPAAVLPVLFGAAVAILLFTLGDADDSPGLSAIGLVTGFLLVMWGLYNGGVIRKPFLLPVILLCMGAGGILLSAALLLDGEFAELPWLPFVGAAVSAAFIFAGAKRLKTAKENR